LTSRPGIVQFDEKAALPVLLHFDPFLNRVDQVQEHALFLRGPDAETTVVIAHILNAGLNHFSEF
jgi:hypothetical protein